MKLRSSVLRFFSSSVSVVLLAQIPSRIPSEDARNTNLPDTNTHFSMPAYHTRAEWEAHKQKLRDQILFAAGLIPLPERNPLHPVIFGRIERKDYTIEKVYIETLPGYYLCGNLYRPRGQQGKSPGILVAHGHWNYGRLENQVLNSGQSRAANLALQGYVAFSYDMVGYNDTNQTPHDFGGAREALWGFSPMGLQLWNSMRAVDFLQSLPDVDADRIGMTGESGGGTQTFLLTAVDDRVKYSVPVNMISAIMQGGSQCENAPGLRLDTFNVEFGAMMAPRPMLMIAATGDWTRNTPRDEYPAVRAVYELYDRVAEVETVQMIAPHNYNQASREAMYTFFNHRIHGERQDVKEHPIEIEKLQDLLVWEGRALPANAVTYDQLEAQWIATAKRQAAETHDVEALRKRLRLALATEWPDHVLAERDGERILFGRPGKGDRVSGIVVGSGVPAVLVVDPEGAEEAARKTKLTSALLLTAFQTGFAVAPRDRSAEYFLTFNRTDDQNRVQDILTALAYMKQEGAKDLRVVGTGKAAVWALFAAAVAGVPVTLDAKLENFAGEDQDFLDRFFVPGIQRAGGLDAARRVLGR